MMLSSIIIPEKGESVNQNSANCADSARITKKELAHAFLAACSYSPPIAPTRRRQRLLNVSRLKFPQHVIPVAAGTASIPNYPQKNGLDMNELVQVAVLAVSLTPSKPSPITAKSITPDSKNHDHASRISDPVTVRPSKCGCPPLGT